MKVDEIKIEGLKEIIDTLNQLPDKISIRLLERLEREALRKNLINPLKNSNSYKTGKKAPIIVKNRSRKADYYAGISNDQFYYWFIEEGTKERYTYPKTGSQHRGKIEAKHFLTPVFNKAEDGRITQWVADNIADKMISYIDSTNKRIEKKLK